ncbi:MAG TPA: penicillin acylase family protein, partial [Candidatus Nanopelagicales bacterium]|nr:penicillin acylase family protein [Candidatus Nanopelagicales bacterium]
ERWTPEHTMAIAKVLSFGMSSTLEYELLATFVLKLAPDVLTDLPFMVPAKDVFTTGALASPTSAPVEPPAPLAPPASIPDAPIQLRPFVGPFASNNWAVSGEHTDNGKPMLAGDPHQALTSPSRFWPVHISSIEAGGTMDVIGFSFIGVPGVQLGHNAWLGWTTTTNFADATDLFEVQAGSDCSEPTVSLGGEMHAVETRMEKILVRGDGEVGTGETREVPIRSIPGHGVFLPDQVLPAPRVLLTTGCILFQWTGFEPSIEASAYLGMDRAKNLDEFESAVDMLDVGAANFIAAHPEDGITYHVNARVPDRGDPASRPMPWRLVSGDDPAALWTHGDLPPSRMPRWRNPERGFLVTANNDPFGFTADASVENDPYYYGTFYANGFRAQRIEELIQERTAGGAKMTLEGMQEIQRDVRWALADELLPLLDQAFAAIETDPALAEYQGRQDLVALQQRLAAWDRRLARDEGEPVIFNALSWFAARRVFEPAYTSLLFETIHEFKPGFFMGGLYNALTGRFPNAGEHVGDPNALLLASLDDTSAWLVARFGSIDAAFTWGDVHLAEFPTEYGGELTVEPFSIDGGDETVNVAPSPFFQGGEVRGHFGTTQASLYRMVLGFADDGTPEAGVNFARGTREDPQGPYFNDR